MATAETIRQIAQARPFEPFALRLIDGTEYDVRHPDYISVPPAPRAGGFVLHAGRWRPRAVPDALD